MTRDGEALERQRIEAALERLYREGTRDLGAEGYIEAIRRIRLEDPAEARRLERVLAPILEERAFPLRKRKWHETSEGTRARLALLPSNPHVRADVKRVRELFQIPSGHVHATPDDRIWKELENVLSRESVGRVADGFLATQWLAIHRRAFEGDTTDIHEREMISAEMRESAAASAVADLGSTDVPDWLRSPSGGSESRAFRAPMDWTAERLVDRHRLPAATRAIMARFILTEDPACISDLEPLQVGISHAEADSGYSEAFTVSVGGIDEFVREEDWKRIWKNYIRPRQDESWERRGMSPHGRRTVDMGRLAQALPLYCKMVADDWDIRDLIRHSIGEAVASETEEVTLNWDQEKVRRAMVDLKDLLWPRDQ